MSPGGRQKGVVTPRPATFGWLAVSQKYKKSGANANENAQQRLTVVR